MRPCHTPGRSPARQAARAALNPAGIGLIDPAIGDGQNYEFGGGASASALRSGTAGPRYESTGPAEPPGRSLPLGNARMTCDFLGTAELPLGAKASITVALPRCKRKGEDWGESPPGVTFPEVKLARRDDSLGISPLDCPSRRLLLR